MFKPKKVRIQSYVCPLCGATGLKSKRGLKKHLDIVHSGYDDFEAIWEVSKKEFNTRGKESKEGQHKANQVPSERNAKPAIKMVRLYRKSVKKVTSLEKDVSDAKQVKSKPKLEVVADPSPEVIPLVGILSIPKGSVLNIDGDIYYQDSVGFHPVKVERVSMTVGLRQAEADGRTWLFCRVDGIVYALDERLVLSGVHKLVSLPPPAAVPDIPQEVKGEVEESPGDIKYREELPEFVSALEAYHEVKQQAYDVEKLLKAARSAHYDHIYDFTKAHGVESEPDKQDYVLREGGYRVWLMRTPGRTQIKRNEAAIIQWCLDNGQEAVLCRALDVQAWEKLKLSGVVPPSVLQLYETQINVDDTFRLSLMDESE